MRAVGFSQEPLQTIAIPLLSGASVLINATYFPVLRALFPAQSHAACACIERQLQHTRMRQIHVYITAYPL